MQTIGFIGLGKMGGNMAARYLASGYVVYGQARNRKRAQWLIDQSLQWVDTPHELARAADIVMTSLPNDQVVESVATGSDGLLAGLGEGKIWADLSTISVGASRKLAGRVRDEGRGATMLDTPVSGSIPQIKTGTLTIMVGGDEDAYRRVEPVLRVLGTPEHVGQNGHGLVLKLAINISLAVQMLAFSEGLLLAERDGNRPAPGRGGHDRERNRLADAQGSSSAGARQTRRDLVRRGADAQGHSPRPTRRPRGLHPAPHRGDRRRDTRPGRAARKRAPRHRRAARSPRAAVRTLILPRASAAMPATVPSKRRDQFTPIAPASIAAISGGVEN